jgi:hypothetical protein
VVVAGDQWPPQPGAHQNSLTPTPFVSIYKLFDCPSYFKYFVKNQKKIKKHTYKIYYMLNNIC